MLLALQGLDFLSELACTSWMKIQAFGSLA